MSSSLRWRIIGSGSTLIAAAVAERALTTAWRRGVGSEPPVKPEDPDNGWIEVLAWGAISGAVLGLARAAATRRAALTLNRTSARSPIAAAKRAV